MSALARTLFAILAAALCAAAVAGQRYGLGEPAPPEQIAGWDIDIRPDGQGLPPGEGTAVEGEELYVARCASCHGEFGEAVGRYPVLMGGEDSLATEDPVKTVGSYWPYASTVFDYVRRAMPFGHAQSLTADETYAITAFLLNLNEIVDDDFVLDARTLPAVEMPNRDGFIADERPDVPRGRPCMHECRGEPVIIGRARQIDVTPETETVAVAAAPAPSGPDPARGQAVFAQCKACHSLAAEEHRVGPSLGGLMGRAAGSADGYAAYSDAMKGSGVTWNADALRGYLKNPQAFLQGTSMPFAGIADDEDLESLIAYLEAEAK